MTDNNDIETRLVEAAKRVSDKLEVLNISASRSKSIMFELGRQLMHTQKLIPPGQYKCIINDIQNVNDNITGTVDRYFNKPLVNYPASIVIDERGLTFKLGEWMTEKQHKQRIKAVQLKLIMIGLLNRR